MCGICGIIEREGTAANRAALEKMNALLLHRGPDDGGVFIKENAGLAMRRLSIIDLSTGRQPMTAEDGTTIVFNGEIYNFQHLRRELESLGHVFQTASDTEVILRGYRQYGTAVSEKLRGMFAFAIYDAPKKRLFISRDRIGKKPLLYSFNNGHFVFSSEMQSLLAAGSISREIDENALDLYMGLQYIPAPQTIFRAVKKLPPAHSLILENGGLSVFPYWRLEPKENAAPMSYEEAKTAVIAKLSESVKLRMIADVPLGAFLSGGIDSSVITALMARQSAKPVKTFSVGFDEKEFSELPYAREIAKKYSTDHTELIVRADMTEVIPLLARHYGEPYADASALPTYYISKAARQHATVVLNGDGGDECFGGYSRYSLLRKTLWLDSIPMPLRKTAAELFGNAPAAGTGNASKAARFMQNYFAKTMPQRYFNTVCIFGTAAKARLYNRDFLRRVNAAQAENHITDFFESARALSPENQMMFADINSYLPHCLMAKVDIASMANSLECRSPLLDHELLELVFPMPGAWKRGKQLLKDASAPLLTPNILGRKKMGFGIPLDAWFRGQLKKPWQEAVLCGRALTRGYFDEKALRQLWDEHQSGRMNHGFRLWTLLMLEIWHGEFSI